MDKPMSNISFKIMSFFLKIRDTLRPRRLVLNEAGIKQNDYVLDYGCGPGSYSLLASNYVGESGKIFALDIHPLAAKVVANKADRLGVTNIETICSDCATGLPNQSIDVVLLYDIYHMLDDQKKILNELHRVLKSNGIISFSDHHMKRKDISKQFHNTELFNIAGKGKFTYTLIKNNKSA